MSKKAAEYIVEDNLNFFDILKSDLNIEFENVCQISGEVLLEDAVRLSCQHIFNYEPLFNDIYEHKKRSNVNEINHVNIRSIRCPYCRQIQNNLLLPSNPLKPDVFGVNYYSEDLDYSVINKNTIDIPKCDYVGKTEKPCLLRLGKKVGDNCFCTIHLLNLRRKKLIEMDRKYQSLLRTQSETLKKNVLLLKSSFCVEILKRGPRKGEKCNNRTKPSFNCCDKHKPK